MVPLQESSGAPSMWAPLVRYMSTSRNPRERISRRFSFRGFGILQQVFPGCGGSGAPDDAPYRPLPDRPDDFPVGGGALHPHGICQQAYGAGGDPGTAETAFSTRAWQAAQLMPVTVYCFINKASRLCFRRLPEVCRN